MHDRDTTPWRRDPWHLLAFRHHALVQHLQRGGHPSARARAAAALWDVLAGASAPPLVRRGLVLNRNKRKQHGIRRTQTRHTALVPANRRRLDATQSSGLCRGSNNRSGCTVRAHQNLSGSTIRYYHDGWMSLSCHGIDEFGRVDHSLAVRKRVGRLPLVSNGLLVGGRDS